MTQEMTPEMFMQAQKEGGLRIDPEAAKVFFAWGYILDPYGIYGELPEEYRCIGRIYFARSPGVANPVCFYDLPEATRKRLWERLERGEFDQDDDWPF